jgi:hypothetical protein
VRDYVSEINLMLRQMRYAKMNKMHLEEYMYSTLNCNMPFKTYEYNTSFSSSGHCS